MGAGRYRGDARSGAMHGSRNTARELFYGADASNLYLRLDFDGAPEFTGVELRTKAGAIGLSNHPGVEHSQRRVFEARVPFELLKISGDEPLSFQIALLNNGVALEQIPQDGWIELTRADSN